MHFNVSRLAPIAILAIMVAAGCADGAEINVEPRAPVEARRDGAIGRATGALSGGADSPKALVESVLVAFGRSDTTRLVELMIDRDEYIRVVYPELGAHFAAARDSRPETMQFLWENQYMNARQGLRKALRELGGDSLDVITIEFKDGTTLFPSYKLHGGTEVTVRTTSGETATLLALGSIIEHEGRFKLFSYRDLE